jgi:hypothetical protein
MREPAPQTTVAAQAERIPGDGSEIGEMPVGETKH